jgi:hypothetical protein
VRGDSLRDLYAKTLALCGLGLLAGVGALVDYWPVGVSVPQVAAAPLALPERYAVGPAERVDVEVRIAQRAPTMTAAPSPVATLASLPIASGLLPVAEQAITLSPPLAPPATMAVTTVASAVPAAEVPLLGPVAIEPPPSLDLDPVPVYRMAAAEPVDDGFLSDALDVVKNTGTTIARGGAKTGASIIGALRSAVRKLKFF